MSKGKIPATEQGLEPAWFGSPVDSSLPKGYLVEPRVHRSAHGSGVEALEGPREAHSPRWVGSNCS